MQPERTEAHAGSSVDADRMPLGRCLGGESGPALYPEQDLEWSSD